MLSRAGAAAALTAGSLLPLARPQVGCRKYSDSDWLRRIRRWPPVMVERMASFLQLRAPPA
jgi:hypothetical protein